MKHFFGFLLLVLTGATGSLHAQRCGYDYLQAFVIKAVLDGDTQQVDQLTLTLLGGGGEPIAYAQEWASETGRIFGSINTIQLAEALKEQGIEIDRRSLKIKEEPIRDAGTYTAEANLHKEVKASFQFEVVGE